MAAIPRVQVGDIPEIADPAVDTEQIERSRTKEVDRCGVRAEETANLGDAVEVPGMIAGMPCGESLISSSGQQVGFALFWVESGPLSSRCIAAAI